ncbi:MAG: hypothetical protein HYU57_00705 [Micavibrio aeruginosavorus]|nr:hypothetical protein [Micavibrio aeruginosavorus]
MTDQSEIDSIPDHLKTKYVPMLKDLFNELNRFAQTFEESADPVSDQTIRDMRDAYLKHVDQVFTDFAADGGTKEQWNVLAPAVHYGHFGP